MAEPKNNPKLNPVMDISEIIQQSGLDPVGQERVEKFFRRESIRTTTRAQVDLNILKAAVQGAPTQDEKIMGVISAIALGAGENGMQILQEANTTRAGKNANLVNVPAAKPEYVPVAAAPVKKEEKAHSQKPHGGKFEGRGDDAGVSLPREIENLKKNPRVSGNPMLILMLGKIEDEVKKGRNIENVREALSNFREGLANPDTMDTMPGVVNALQNFEKTDTLTALDEGRVVFFISIVRQIYALGGRLVFLTNNDIEVKGSQELTNFISSCKPKTKEWLKKGLILNSTQAGNFMSSMGSDMSKLTVDTFIATNRDLMANGSDIDSDILSSSTAGGFNVMENGALKRDGFNVGKELQTTQDAIERWKKIGIVPPMQKIGGTGVQLADMAYNVVKVGFVAGTIWKGTKAIWKTIFGDEAAMKSAWGEFGKTAAWTAGIWYGGELVKRTANNIAERTQNGEFGPLMAGMSPHHSENVWAIWDMVGGGIVPERIKTANIIEGLSSSTVEWYKFRSLITDCFSDRNSGLSRISATELADAIGYRDHTSVGSHVGNIRKLLTSDNAFGPDKGEEMYLKYFGDRETAEQSYKVLRAIAGYRSTGPDAIDRRKPVWDLFAEPLQVVPEVPFNVDPEMDAIKKSLKSTAESGTKLALKTVNLGVDFAHIVFEGAGKIVDFPIEMWKGLNAEQKANVIEGVRTLGLAGLTGLAFAYGPGGWIGITLKSVLGGATVWSGAETVMGWINKETGESLDGVRGLLKKIYDTPLIVPDDVKAKIKPFLDPKVPLTEAAAQEIINEIKGKVTDPTALMLIGLMEDALKKAQTNAPETGGGGGTPAPAPVPSTPPTPHSTDPAAGLPE